MLTQLDTSIAVRPQPRQISSNSVEHTATQGVSGRFFSGAAIAKADERRKEQWAVQDATELRQAYAMLMAGIASRRQ
jgi:hypothetical protein